MKQNDTTLRTLDPTVLVIFGITGNLASLKLLPALYQLLRFDHLPKDFKIVGIFRDAAYDQEKLIKQLEIDLLRKYKEADQPTLNKLNSIMTSIKMDSTEAKDYSLLNTELDRIDTATKVIHNRLFYLAIPPQIFKSVISNLASVELHEEKQNCASRILVEKPFGSDLASAKDLISHMSQSFAEKQIYRIDHYLAKETAQNILAFRFNNPAIESLWHRQSVDHIQITASETIGIEGRSAFYENMGALRDLIQSHMLQLMAIVLMEAPESMSSENIHAEKQELLRCVQVIRADHINEIAVRGQYDGYKEEANNPNSHVETFVALKLEVTNSRWGGVPILLRTGKALKDKHTGITVVFKDRTRRRVPENHLRINIQPNEGITLKLTAKKPGFKDDTQPVHMSFCYESEFTNNNPDAYERVLIDAVAGDQSLFATSEEIIRCWEIIEPLLSAWLKSGKGLEIYDKQTWGPQAGDDLAHSFAAPWINE